jgi:hypothetical protein
MISSLQETRSLRLNLRGSDDLLVTLGDEFTSEIHLFEPRRLRIFLFFVLVFVIVIGDPAPDRVRRRTDSPWRAPDRVLRQTDGSDELLIEITMPAAHAEDRNMVFPEHRRAVACYRHEEFKPLPDSVIHDFPTPALALSRCIEAVGRMAATRT